MEVGASIAQIVDKARNSWLKNHEVLELLQEFSNAGLSVCQEPPVRPEGGQLFLFDRRVCRFFRRDGHNWRKKPDGKTIRETHEKLKVGNSETLNCYYAHADQEDGLQRRCYWQLDTEREHIVLVHYLCCASSRAGNIPAAGRAGSLETPSERPPRRNPPRRASSPATARPRRGGGVGGSQPKLSPVAGSASLYSSGSLSGSLHSSLPSQGLMGGELDGGSDDDVALPLMPGMSDPEAAALPSLAAQYAMQQAALELCRAPALQLGGQPGMQQHHHAQPLHQVEVQEVAPALPAAALPLLALGLPPRSGAAANPHVALPPLPLLDMDPFAELLSDSHSRPHPGVLYTGQRMASNMAAQQQAAHTLHAAGPLVGHRPLFQQESFTLSDQHRNLFRQMSLGIQHTVDHEPSGGYFLGSPTERSLDPMSGEPGKGSSGGPGSGEAGTGTPGGDLASLLSSPGHRRTFSRQGSGLSRLISKNWESELPMDLMLSEVDADLSTYPVGSGAAADGAERTGSPSSRIVNHAGIAFLGSAGGAAVPAHTLEPSPLGVAGLSPGRTGVAGSHMRHPGSHGSGGSGTSPPRFAQPAFPTPATADGGSNAGSPTLGSPPSHLLFAAGDGSSLAQRASRERASARAAAGAGAGMPCSGSHPHLAHLSRRSGGASAEAPSGEDLEALLRRQERVEAAALAAQEHRDLALAAARSRRAVQHSSDDAEDGTEMIDVPENMQRLSSFLSRGRQLTGGREMAAMAAEAEVLEVEARSLFKHMSIDEAEALAALAPVVKGLELMPTIADGSSELEVTASGVHSFSDEYTSH